jgi:hypothetical protein
VLQILEDCQRLLPGLPGPGRLADGLAVVTEVGKGFRFMDAVAGFPGDSDRAPIACGGLFEVAQIVLGVAQATFA